MKYTTEELERLVDVATAMTNCRPGSEDWEALEVALQPFTRSRYTSLEQISKDCAIDLKTVKRYFYLNSVRQDLDFGLNRETFDEQVATSDVPDFVRRMKKVIESTKPLPAMGLSEPFMKHFRGMEE